MNLTNFFKSDFKSTGLLIARITAGVVMLPHGAQKMLGAWGGSGFSGTIDAFQQYMGFPAILTVLVIFAEFFGSLALILGFAGRFMAFSIFLTMFGALFISGNIENGFFMNWFGQQTGEGIEYHLLMIGLTLALSFTGSGRLSVDQVIHSKLSK